MLPLLLTAALTAAPDAGWTRAAQERELMSTRVLVVLGVDLPAEQQEEAFRTAFDAFAEVERDMNEWVADSPLGRINASAGGPPVVAPVGLCDVLRRSLEGARRTRGLFDPTWAALRGLWRFSELNEGVVPPKAEVAARCRLVGWGKVELTALDGAPGCAVRLPKAGMQLGLGGVAKGWGVDRAVQRLRQRGLKDFFVQAGGDLYLAGKNHGRPWRVGIRDPRGPPEATFATLEVSDAAFSTSGDYEHFFFQDGVRYHHIIDLRTCAPATRSRSATVLAKSAVEAEFLTKSVFILGGAEGLKLAKELGAEAVVVGADNQVHLSPTLKGRLRWRPPSP